MRKGMVLPAVLAGLLLAGAGAGTAMAAGNGDGTREAAAALSMRTLMESLRQVSSDVAHDLRTPLTRLYQRLEGARASASTVTEYEAAVDAASAEADELLKTFASLLRIAQVEGAPPAAGFGPVDLSALAETVADAYQPDMEAQHHRLDTAIEPGIMIWGDRELLTPSVRQRGGERVTPYASRNAHQGRAWPATRWQPEPFGCGRRAGREWGRSAQACPALLPRRTQPNDPGQRARLSAGACGCRVARRAPGDRGFPARFEGRFPFHGVGLERLRSGPADSGRAQIVQ